MKKDLNKSLDLSPNAYDTKDGVDNIKNVPAIVDADCEVVKSEIEEDIDNSRNSIYELLDIANDAIADMVDIAKQSQHPKAYDTLNSMLKTTAGLYKDILGVQSRKKELMNNTNNQPQSPETDGAIHNTQNIFVGSTTELQNLLNDMRKDKDGS